MGWFWRGMTFRFLLPLSAVAVVAGCATHSPVDEPHPRPVAPLAVPSSPVQHVTPAADLIDQAGDSTATAISVPADAPEEGVMFENNWIFDRYGRFRRLGGGTGVGDGRRYDVIEIELPGGAQKKVYFDITENWARWKR